MAQLADRIRKHDSIAFLRDKGLNVVAVPASDMALELGNVRTANVLMLGALSRLLDIPAGTARSRLYRALQSMRATIEADERAPESATLGRASTRATS